MRIKLGLKPFLIILFLSLLFLQGCLREVGELCITNMEDVLENNALPQVFSDDYVGLSQKQCPSGIDCGGCGGNWYDCSEFQETGFCKICALRDKVNNEIVEFPSPLEVSPCPGTFLAGEKCEFGCTYLVCYPSMYYSPQKESFSIADAEENRRVFGEGVSLTYRLPNYNFQYLVSTQSNFLYARCEFRELTPSSLEKLKSQRALFVTYRIGAGRSFEDFEIARTLVPFSSYMLALNPSGFVDDYYTYLTEEMINNQQLCVKKGDYWVLNGYSPSSSERINNFTTFAECMLNAKQDFLFSPNEKKPFSSLSFCYSQEYKSKQIPFLNNGELFNEKGYEVYVTPYLFGLSFDKEILQSLVSSSQDLGSFEFSSERKGDEYYLPTFSKAKSSSLGKIRNITQGIYENSTITILEGAPLNSYPELLRRVPTYYEQFKFGSMDKEGRERIGAEYECRSGQDCLSSFCNKKDYYRSSCTAIENGELVEVPCGCTGGDCNYLYPDSYNLFDGTPISQSSPNKPYLSEKDLVEKHPKVLVMKPYYYGEGSDRFIYLAHLGGSIFVYVDYNITARENQNINSTDPYYCSAQDIRKEISDKYVGIIFDGRNYIKDINLEDVCRNIDQRYPNNDVNLTLDADPGGFLEDVCGNLNIFGGCKDQTGNSLIPSISDSYYSSTFSIAFASVGPQTEVIFVGTNLFDKSYPILNEDLSPSDYRCYTNLRGDDIFTLVNTSGGGYNIKEREDAWLFPEELGENGPISIVDDNGRITDFNSPLFPSNIGSFKGVKYFDDGRGPFLRGVILEREAIPAPSKTFVKENTQEMYIMNYFTGNPEFFEQLVEQYEKERLFLASYGEVGPWVDVNYSLLFFDLASDVSPMLPIGFEKQTDLGFQDGKRCAVIESGIPVISYGAKGQDLSLARLSDLRDYLFLAPKAWPSSTSPSNYETDSTYLNYLSYSGTSQNDFPVYDNCNENQEIEYAFCFNPYITKYPNSLYQGDSLMLNLSNSPYSINPELCAELPPKYFCLGSWVGDEYEGTCFGDMAVSAFVFKDEISDGKFGKCIANDTLTGLRVNEFGYCEGSSPLNLAFEEIESSIEISSKTSQYIPDVINFTSFFDEKSSFRGTLNLIALSKNIDGTELIKEVGRILSPTPPFIETIILNYPEESSLRSLWYDVLYTCMIDKDCDKLEPPSRFIDYWEWNPVDWELHRKYLGKEGCLAYGIGCDKRYAGAVETRYIRVERLWEYEFLDPIANTFLYSYTLPSKAYLYFLSLVDADPPLEKFSINYEKVSGGSEEDYEEGRYRFDLQDLPDEANFSFYGVFTKAPKSEEFVVAPRVTFYSNESFNPPNFYPSNYYLKDRLISYMGRGILPVLIVDDPSLYEVKYTNLDKGYDPFFKPSVEELSLSLPLLKLLQDVQLAIRDPYNERGFSFFSKADTGTAIIVTNKLILDSDNKALYSERGYSVNNQNTISRIKAVKASCKDCLVGISIAFDKPLSSLETSDLQEIFEDNARGLSKLSPFKDQREDKYDVVIFRVGFNIIGLDELRARSEVDKLVEISRLSLSTLGLPTIFYINDIVYANESELELFFSYLNYRKSALISNGNIGIQFEDVLNKNNIPGKRFYLLPSPEGICQFSRNLMSLGGFVNLKSSQPYDVADDCETPDCIPKKQCVSKIRCEIKKDEIAEFEISEYSEELSDFIGLSLSQTGFSLCDNETSKTVAIASQYVAPITFNIPPPGFNEENYCYPTALSPQELSEIFTQGIKYATCYPVE